MLQWTWRDSVMKIFPQRWTLTKEMSTMCVPSSWLFWESSLSLIEQQRPRFWLSCQDVSDWLLVRARCVVIYSPLWPQMSWLKWISICFGRTEVFQCVLLSGDAWNSIPLWLPLSVPCLVMVSLSSVFLLNLWQWYGTRLSPSVRSTGGWCHMWH